MTSAAIVNAPTVNETPRKQLANKLADSLAVKDDAENATPNVANNEEQTAKAEMKLPHPKAAEDVNEPLLQEVDYHIIN
jgi:hypothetical protein